MSWATREPISPWPTCSASATRAAPRPRSSGAELDANFAIATDARYWANRQGAAEMRLGAGDLLTSELIDDPRLKDVTNGGQASFKGPMVRMSDEARLLMKRAMIMFPEGRDPIPAAVMGEQGEGKGRVVYFAAGLDAANFSYGYPWQRVVLARAIRWAARDPAPVAVDAPCASRAPSSAKPTPTAARPRRPPLQRHQHDHRPRPPRRSRSPPRGGGADRRHQGPFRGQGFGRIHLEPEGTELAPRWMGIGRKSSAPGAVHATVVAEIRPK